MLPPGRGRFMAWRSAQAWTWTVHGLEVSPGLDVDGSWPGGQPRPGRGRFMAWRSAQAWTWTVHGLEVSPGLDVDGESPGGQHRLGRGRFMAWRSAQAWTWTVHGLEVSPGLDVDGSWPGGQPRPGRGRFMAWRSAQDRVDEGGRLERRQVVGALAEADQLDGHAQFPLDSDDDPALGGAVELGQDDPRDVHHLSEHPRLAESVLAGGGVKDQQDLIHGGALLDDALDLAEFVHQPGFRVQPPGGVHDDGIHPPRDALADRLEGDTGRIRALPVRADHSGTHPRAPGFQLVGGCGTERVGRAEQHGAAITDQGTGELAAGGGLARAVHSHHEQHGGPVTVALDVQRAVHVRADRADEFAAQHGPHVIRVPRASHPDLGLELLNDLAGRTHAHVRGEQCVLDVLPCLVIQGATGEQAEQHRTEPRLRPGQAAAQPGQPTSQRWRLLNAGGFRLRRRRQHGCWRTSRARLAGLAGRTRRGWRGPGRRWRRGRPAAPRAGPERAAADYH